MSKYNLRYKITSLAPNTVATKETTKKNIEPNSEVDVKNATVTEEVFKVNVLCAEKNEEMATFSDEQFQQILAAMSGNVRSGSFTQCTARFKGQRDPAAVEEFLSAISVYKDIEKISDIDALKGMPLLLEDYAASWWIGVKDNVLTFEQAMSLIRSTFTPPVSDWRIFSNFFETKQQKNEPTDVFICKKRLLLSQLKVPPTETIQINMLYGLLNINIRERVRRENVNTFEQLISASREAEMFFLEAKPVPTADSELKKDAPNVNRYSFCRIKGHTVETCFKKKKRDERQNNPQITQQNQNSLNPRQPQQSDVMRKPTFSCYGCGAPGVYRSNCTTCSSSGKDSPQYLAFNSLSSTVIGHSLPTIQVEFFGLKGEAIFDSGAKTSVASLELKKILTANKCVFQDVRAEITLADGSVSTGKVMSTICNIIIGNRLRKIRLIYLPNAMENRTLLGADFMEQAGIVLNMAQKYWYFEDKPRQKFSFANLLETNICSLQIRDETSPCTKAVKEMSPFIKFIEGKNVLSPIPGTPKPTVTMGNATPLPKTPSFVNQYDSPCSIGKVLEEKLLAESLNSHQQLPDQFLSPMRTSGNDYSPRYIQSIFKKTMATIEGQRSPKVPPTKPRKIQQIEDTDDYFTPLFSMDFKILKESDGVGLTPNQRSELDQILVLHQTIFEDSTGATPYAIHRIHTEEHDPIAIPPYRLSSAMKTALKDEITIMLDSGVIVECQSPWAAPVVIVPKKTGGIRVCIDYRELNSITKPDRYPLPRVDDILHEAKATSYMSTIDLQSGYWQIISDNSVQFISAVMQKVVYCLNIDHILTPVYHPEANPVERKNRDMKAQLAILVGNDHQSWDEKLPSIRFAMNTTLCQSTKYTPAFLTFGRQLRTLDDVQHDLRSVIQSENFLSEITPYLQNLVNVFKDVKENVRKQQDHNKRNSNNHRRNQPPLEIGLKVLVTTHVLSNTGKGVTSKFVPKRDGPYVIIEKKGTTSYVIAHEDDVNMPLGTYHASALTPVVGSTDPAIQPVRRMRTRGRPRK